MAEGSEQLPDIPQLVERITDPFRREKAEKRARILDEISQERFRGDLKHGQKNKDNDLARWMLVLASEYGEAAQDAAKSYFIPFAANTFLVKLRTELIQTASVCVAIIEWIDRRLDS